MKRIQLILAAWFVFVNICQAQMQLTIPLGGNAFSSNPNSKTIGSNGISNWTDKQEMFSVYFRIAQPGDVVLSFDKVAMPVGEGSIQFELNGAVKEISLNANVVEIGKWQLSDSGYVEVKVRAIKIESAGGISIPSLTISGAAVNDQTFFVKNNEGNFFYWGRRGPSTHLSYQMPPDINAEWFYNEITVPHGNDIVGSYFMANGFAEGYFGMQVNSATERRILFSVWSPFNTDDPKSIPESHKIKMKKKGAEVYTGEFGNEGSGGQSYLRFNWIAGNTYQFLLHGKPTADSTTTYTAWFFAPEENQWRLIASFQRPKTSTYLKRFHSFLENFIPQTGNIKRRVLFNNQWIADAQGKWVNLNTARFTTDNTGNKKFRMDFAGGLETNNFYLEIGGFFNNYTLPRTLFVKPANAIPPAINFTKLP